jgi:F-type H+-transporting ATPase subunit b
LNKYGLIGLGIVFLIIGYAVKDQSWTRPEMFAGLQLDLGKTVTNIGVFLVFIPIINMYFYVPLKEAMDARNHELESTFTEAEQLRSQMQALKTDFETRLIQTEAEARSQIQNQIKEAQNLRQQLMAEAGERADALIRQAQLEIDNEKAHAIATIRTHVVDLTLAAAEKVIGENMDSEKNRRLISEFIDTVEVAS